jgi:FAD/FMN-containing dehydrogenase/Fe-S oxidoreductase
MTIPRLAPNAQAPALYRTFLDTLASSGFEGEIRMDYASRLVAATDNSVYQKLPAAVVFPKHEADVVRLLTQAHEPRFREIALSPRGGGTGTNGQSLCDGIIVDVSRHMNAILEVDLRARTARVQPGVVLDQLNNHLRPHGLFFAPNLSPSSRATLGGMVSTDASGQGSRVYGKTSNHVLALRSVLLDGSVLDTAPIDLPTLEAQCARADQTGHVYRTVRDVVTRRATLIAERFPKLQRFLTGYNLAHVRTADGRFNLNAILAGAEGTLAVLTEIKVNLCPVPKARVLLAVRYPDFDAALRAANVLVASNPGSIETIDDTIVRLARGDTIWHSVQHLIEAPDEPPLQAINLVEFEGDDPALVEAQVTRLTAELDAERGQPSKSSGYTVARASKDISSLWSLRKKGVGLLGNAEGERRPVPFVEDTAVPPEHLADYIVKFRAILDRHGLRYGMFGHVDVGCLHVRPALNLRDPEDERLLRRISDEVVALVQSYGGVLWAEHGKGFRSEYSPTFFGPELYEELRTIKGAFDPHNQLNPGKLATPAGTNAKLLSIDSLKRGHFDRAIHEHAKEHYDRAIHCNGNGACFDYDPDHVMCPSAKVTRDRIHSPKGRAGILREWLRLLSEAGHNVTAPATEPGLITLRTQRRQKNDVDFSHEVYDAMNGCLACKACATQCPVKVDIPEMRSQFLQLYHSRYRRPLKDYFVAALESMVGLMAALPGFFNWIQSSAWFKTALRRWVGIVDSPLLGRSLDQGLRALGAPSFDRAALAALSPEEKQRSVLIAQDVFTRFYEPDVALSVYRVLTRLGLRVVFLPYLENGKALHIKGFLRSFQRTASRASRFYSQVAELGIPIVGIEPAVTLTYRDEYRTVLGTPGKSLPFQVQLLQEYLTSQRDRLRWPVQKSVNGAAHSGSTRAPAYTLFGHCTERTAAAKSDQQWQQVFQACGLELKSASVGCCGMCGVYGHEAEHFQESRGIFTMSWDQHLPKDEPGRAVAVVPGHSCRSQVKRFAGFVPQHPVQALDAALAGHSA